MRASASPPAAFSACNRTSFQVSHGTLIPNKSKNKNFARALLVTPAHSLGCVGNRAAIFPLQTLGFDADSINTVQFSNHTGYPVFKGSHTSREQLQLLVDGLEENGEAWCASCRLNLTLCIRPAVL
jgi:pyridoxal/pyridoxine/pyridoxamine kinase